MGEEKKEEGKGEGEKKEEQEGKKSEAAEEKKDEKKEEAAQSPEIVLKVDMHCEACARKVARALKGFQGVEKVTADCKGSKVVVKGKDADPLKVCERIQKKCGRKVELISPLPKPPSPEQENKPPLVVVDDKKEEPPAVITVVLKVQMHCDACAQRLQKGIRKVKGVESVTTDLANNQVTVKGIVDPEKLVADVYKRTGKQASVHMVIKEEEKKEEEKKEEEKKEEQEKAEGKKEEGKEGEDKNKTEMKKSEYWPQRLYMEYYYAYPPQMFSDENPHACTLM